MQNYSKNVYIRQEYKFLFNLIKINFYEIKFFRKKNEFRYKTK